jgi:SAM-dependent methyltransferase
MAYDSSFTRQGEGTPERYFSVVNSEIVRLIPERPGRILDVGCADGSLGEMIRLNKKPDAVVGIEPVEAVAARAKGKLDAVHVGEAGAVLPLIEGSSFDWIILADSLEHMADPWKTVSEIKRILKPAGRLALSVPNVRNLNVILALLVRGQWHYDPSGILDKGHLRFFTRASVQNLLQEQDFKILRCFSNPRTRWKKTKGKIAARMASLLIAKPSAYEEFITFQWIVEAQKKQSPSASVPAPERASVRGGRGKTENGFRGDHDGRPD